MGFDAISELKEIKKSRKKIRRKRYTKSRLDQFQFELLELHKKSARLGDLQFFLKKNRTKVALSTIQRWLKKHA